MKELVRKELREHVKVTLLGLLIFAVVLVRGYQVSTEALARLGQSDFGHGNDLQPLLTNFLLNGSGFFCAIFGALLGWLQIRSEKHLDLWAFLVHRPIPRTRILQAKILAGCCLYALAVGVPLLVLVIVVRLPGHIAAPFRWAMVLPLVGYVLAGIVCYFAGMLTALRQARWYASRALALGAAAVAVFAVARAAEFWQVLVLILVLGAVLAAAVRGSFQSGGYYHGQPLTGRLALSAALFAGSSFVLGVAIGLLTSLVLKPLLHDAGQYDHYSYYSPTEAGTIIKVTQHSNGQFDYTDTNGRPLSSTQYLQMVASAGVWATVQSGRRSMSYYGYSRPEHFFTLWCIADKNLWYFTRQGRLVGYSGTSRRFIGVLQPAASANSAAVENRFLTPEHYPNLDPYPRGTLASSTALYRVDVSHRKLHPLFKTTNDNSIVASVSALPGHILVVTRRFIQLLTGDGATIWRMPFSHWYPDYDRVGVYPLKETGAYAVLLSPSDAANEKSGWKLTTHVTWIAGATVGSPVRGRKSLDLPPLPRPSYPHPFVGQLLITVIPPVLPTLAAAITGRSPLVSVWLFLIPALACGGIGWWLGGRYNFSLGARVGWGVFHLLCGVPGLLAFVSVQEWPVRERCPNCSGLRTVDRDRCEHCGAEFLPPEATGTEIFAALESETS